jgi:hypothetical protein
VYNQPKGRAKVQTYDSRDRSRRHHIAQVEREPPSRRLTAAPASAAVPAWPKIAATTCWTSAAIFGPSSACSMAVAIADGSVQPHADEPAVPGHAPSLPVPVPMLPTPVLPSWPEELGGAGGADAETLPSPTSPGPGVNAGGLAVPVIVSTTTEELEGHAVCVVHSETPTAPDGHVVSTPVGYAVRVIDSLTLKLSEEYAVSTMPTVPEG